MGKKRSIKVLFEQTPVEKWSMEFLLKYIQDENVARVDTINLAIKELKYIAKHSKIPERVARAKSILEAFPSTATTMFCQQVSTPAPTIIKTKGIQINQSVVENIYNDTSGEHKKSSNNKEQTRLPPVINTFENSTSRSDINEPQCSTVNDKRKASDDCSSSSPERKYSRNDELEAAIESDGIKIPGTEKSLATIIKQEAILVHAEFVKGKKLTVKERKIMSTGLSSILDLVDERPDGQKQFFTKDQWTYIKILYKPLKIKPVTETETAVDTWKIVTKACQAAGSVRLGEEYLTLLRNNKTTSDENRLLYKAMEHMLELIETKGDMLSQRNKFTEYDYLRVIWSPLLERLFPAPLRLISGESIFTYTNKKKQVTYDSNSAKGFKIDVRFVGDKQGMTYDLGAAEFGKDGAEWKLLHDEGKLVREGKDAVDCLLETLHESNHLHVMSWEMQVDAAEVRISTLHLVGNGLYVSYPQFEFDLPTSLDDMEQFEEALKAFVTMKYYMMKIYSRLSTQGHKDGVIRKVFNSMEDSSIENNGIESWMRGTWYTPSRPSKSRLPIPLFGKISAFDFTRRIITTRNQDLLEDENEKATVDVYGWTKRNDKWYNVHTKKVAYHHPHHSPPISK